MKNPQIKNGIVYYKNKNGKFHRKTGPAIINKQEGWEAWLINGKLHRKGGPAIVGPTGTQYWCQNGKLHNEEGPAILYPDGRKEYCVKGKVLELTDRVFKKICKPTMENINSYLNDSDEDTKNIAEDWFCENAGLDIDDEEEFYYENNNEDKDSFIK